MAEQSMFWPTTGTGDGISGGYTSDRLVTIWKAILGDGQLVYQNKLALSGTGTSALAIDTGAAIVSGYLYENNTSASINTSTLGSATYGVYIIANESASALTVSRSVAGTTVGSKTVRLAVNASTPTQPYIQLGTITTAGGSITAISTANSRWAVSRNATLSSTASLYVSSMSVLTATDTIISGTGSVSTTDSEYISMNASTGAITVKQAGTYFVQVSCNWDTTTTNRRKLSIDNGATVIGMQLTGASFITATYTQQVAQNANYYDVGSTINCYIWQDSGSTRTATEVTVTVTRL
jgi:hypothetical protein